MMPTQLTEDRSDSAIQDLAAEVREAEAALTELVKDDVTRVWTIRELQDTVAEIGGWSSSVASIAYRRIVRRGDVIEVGSDLLVRVLTAS